MKKLKLWVLGIASLSMLVSGCSGTSPVEEVKNPEEPYRLDDDEMYEVLTSWQPRINIKQDDTLNPVFDAMSEVPEEHKDRLSPTLFDYKRGSTLNVKLINEEVNSNGFMPYEYQTIIAENDRFGNYVQITDVGGQNPDFVMTTDGNRLKVEINESFVYGGVYTVELLMEDTLYFEGKDKSIQKLTIEIEDDPNEAATYDIEDKNDNIKLLDLAKVSGEESDATSKLSFTYEGSLPTLNPGDIFLVKNNQNDDKLEITDFYGKFVSAKELAPNKYQVVYEEPQGDEIYDDLHKKGVQPLNLEDNLTPIMDKDEIAAQLRSSSFSVGLINFCAKIGESKNKKILGDILDKLELDINFNVYNNKLTFSVTLHVDKVPLGESKTLFLSFSLNYTQISEFTGDFDIGIKTKWFIPVGISYKLKLVQNKQESFEFNIAVDYEKETPPMPEEEIKNTLYDELKKAKEGNNSFYQRLMDDANAVAQTEGNKTTIPLFSVTCPIYPPVVFEFKIDFIIDLSVQAMFTVKKQWETQTVLFNFSNQSGGGGDTGQTVKGSTNWDFYLMGKIEVTFSLRFSGAIYAEGTYKFCHVEVYFEIYVKIGIQGVLMASFATDTDGSSFSGNICLDLYILMGAKVGLEIVVTFLKVKFNFDVFKTYILRFCFTNTLEHFADSAPTTIEMTKTRMSLDETNVLKFRTWNGVTMRMEDDQKYSAKDVTKLIESWFGDLNIRMFKFEAKQPELMEITEDGELRVKDGTPADFTTTIVVKVSNFAGFVADREIVVNFSAPDAHHIYIEDEDMGRFRPGNVYTLPEPRDNPGYKFLNYRIGDQILNPGDTITVGSEDIHVEVDWHKIIYYTVIFYDGLDNLIYIDPHAEEFKPVTPPKEEIRDQFMKGYFFIGWDKKIDYITCDLVVHGIYMKVGD